MRSEEGQVIHQHTLATAQAGKQNNWATHPLVEGVISNFGAFQDTIPVRLIATPRENLKMCDPEEDLLDVIARNVDDQFDHFPVISRQTIIGLVDLRPFAKGVTATGKVWDCTYYSSLSEANLIGADAGILSFVRDADSQTCRLLVSKQRIEGLVSLSDLQRLPVRASLFAMVTLLEMVMVDVIRRECTSTALWLSRISAERQSGLRAEIEKAKASDAFVDEILFTQFADKVTIIKKGDRANFSKSAFKAEMAAIQRLRNALAHANEYASTQESAASVCATVRSIERWILSLQEAAEAKA
jgi:hypothetical protein